MSFLEQNMSMDKYLNVFHKIGEYQSVIALFLVGTCLVTWRVYNNRARAKISGYL